MAEDVPHRAPLTLGTRVFLGLFGLMFSAVLIELALHLVPLRAQSRTWSDRPYAYLMPEGVRTLQDTDPAPKKPDTFRIIVVGDSFTFGPNMQYADTFPKKLEWMLNLNASAPRVEVLNRGVCGASTVSEVELVKQALREAPDLLILEITLNDAEPHILSQQERDEVFGSPWLSWRIINWSRALGFLAQRIHNSRTVTKYIDYHSKFFKDPESLDRFDRSLASISAQAKNANIPIIAVLFPLFDFPINERYPFADVHRIIATSATKHSLQLVDLQAAYQAIPPERLQVIPGDDNHPNEIAHRIAAERLLAALIDRKLVPETSAPTSVFRSRKELTAHGANRDKVFRRAAATTLSRVDQKDTDAEDD